MGNGWLPQGGSISGHVFRVDRARGPVWFAKYRLPDGVNPGDVIVADDDGVVVVARSEVQRVTAKSREREEKEARNREQLQAGQLGIDIYGMRDKLKEGPALREERGGEKLKCHPGPCARDPSRRSLQRPLVAGYRGQAPV